MGRAWRRSSTLCLAVPAPVAALAGGVLLAGAYALFSGWGVPAQRTVCMLAVVALLRLSGRRWPWPHVWLLACAVVLALDPWALLQPGFWLSFVAVAVLFATDPIAGSARGISAGARFLSMLREQWVITLAITPLTLLLFGQVSLVGFAANVVAIPWTTLVVTPLALAGVLWAPLWQAAAWCVQGLSALLHWLAAWPWAQAALPMAPLWAGAAAVVGGVILALRLPWRARLLGLPLVLPALWWQPSRPDAGQFELLAVDVGQGQAVLVRTARHTLIYDAGPRYHQDSDAGERVLVPLLRALGERLDMLVLSHGDSDHTGGAAAVLAQHPQAQLRGSIEAGHPLQALHAVEPCVAGQRWHWDGVGFEVLHPPPGAPATRPNAQSCVLRVTAAAEGGARAPPRCSRGTSSVRRSRPWWPAARRWRPTCCSSRITAARPRRATLSWMRCIPAPRWCRRATATASAIRRRLCCSAMRTAASPWCRRPGVVRPRGRRQGCSRCAANARRLSATGTTAPLRTESVFKAFS